MKIVFLGTNGWYTNQNGNTPCVLIDSKDHYVIFDAGNGFYKLDRYITRDKPVSLFISHFHLDHVSGFHTLGKFAFSRGLDIYLANGRKKDFETLVNRPFTLSIYYDPKNIAKMKMPIRIHELLDGKHTIPFPISVVEQFHAYKDHGYRVTLEGKTIAYSGDCGKTEKSIALAKNADLLIHECSWNRLHPHDNWGHVVPEQAAQIAKEAGVKKLILTHFDPTRYKTMQSRKDAEKKAKKIFANTLAAVDDMIISL